MEKLWTREELKSLMIDEEKIDAILSVQQPTEAKNPDDISEKVSNVTVVNNVIPFKGQLDESQITSIDDIKKYSGGAIVELPPFDGVHTFIAKLCRPSMLMMVKKGKIPNTLLNQATQLFQKGAGSLGKDNTISDMYDIIEAVCECALVKPTYREIKEAGLSLTDEQMMAIFSYTQQGVKALEQFR